jgi:hypothetical protein
VLSDLYGLKLAELLAPNIPAASGGQEEELAEVRLVRTLAQLAPKGTFSLRYLHDPAQPGELQVALLGRIQTEAEEDANAEEMLVGLGRALGITFKDHRFEPLKPEELQRLLAPFDIKDAVEFTRQMVALNIASWEFVPQAPLGFTASSAKGQAEAPRTAQELSLYVLPFLPARDGWSRLYETLLLQPQACLIDLALWPTTLPEAVAQGLEAAIDTANAICKARRFPGSPTKGRPTFRPFCVCGQNCCGIASFDRSISWRRREAPFVYGCVWPPLTRSLRS